MSHFRPLPLFGNPHVQTILGNLLPRLARPPVAQRRTVTLPDGDGIALHETQPCEVSVTSPIALLIHGLGGCHNSGYMERTTRRLSALGWRVIRMDLRGAGVGIHLARRFYNAACSADVAAVVDHLVADFPLAPLAIVGFSLGGNITLKYAGELADGAPPNLRRIAVIAPPIDLVRCSDLIAQYPVYDRFYVRHLTQQVAEHQRLFPELPRVEFPRRMILRDFDEIYTAPRWGYENALDYYRRASSLPWIQSIRVPTFVLTSRDDPFVAVEPFESLRANDHVRVQIMDHGGHMGFLGLDGAGGIRWGETQVIAWLDQCRFEP